MGPHPSDILTIIYFIQSVILDLESNTTFDWLNHLVNQQQNVDKEKYLDLGQDMT